MGFLAIRLLLLPGKSHQILLFDAHSQGQARVMAVPSGVIRLLKATQISRFLSQQQIGFNGCRASRARLGELSAARGVSD